LVLSRTIKVANVQPFLIKCVSSVTHTFDDLDLPLYVK